MIKAATLVSSFLFGMASWGLAQSPTHIPRESSEPVPVFESIENIIVFIVLPAVVVLLYVLWRKNRNKQRNTNTGA